MGFFKKSASGKTRSSSTAVSIIAQGTRFSGELEVSGKLHIDGQVDGTIRCHKSITIGKQGLATGHIIAESIYVSGELDGEVSCVDLNVDNHGTVKGQVCSDRMSIAERGNFVGERSQRAADTVLAIDGVKPALRQDGDSSNRPEQREV